MGQRWLSDGIGYPEAGDQGSGPLARQPDQDLLGAINFVWPNNAIQQALPAHLLGSQWGRWGVGGLFYRVS